LSTNKPPVNTNKKKSHLSITTMMFSDQVDITIKEHLNGQKENYVAPLTENELMFQITQNRRRMKNEIIGKIL
jgi:hypothetical protein